MLKKVYFIGRIIIERLMIPERKSSMPFSRNRRKEGNSQNHDKQVYSKTLPIVRMFTSGSLILLSSR